MAFYSLLFLKADPCYDEQTVAEHAGSDFRH